MLRMNTKYIYLRKKCNSTSDGIIMRPDLRLNEKLAEACEIGRGKPKSVPCSTDINSTTHMVYISGEMSDAQYAIHMLDGEQTYEFTGGACDTPCQRPQWDSDGRASP